MTVAFGAAVGWLLFACLLLVAGSVVARLLVIQDASHPVTPNGWLEGEAARVGRLGSNALPAVLLLVLVRQIREFRDPFAPLTEDVGLLLGTSWGTAWLWALVWSVVAAGSFRLAAAGRSGGWWVAAAATVVLSSFPAATGHAGGGDGAIRWLTLSADVLHVLAAGAWMGGLAVVLSIERRWRRFREPDSPESLLPLLVPRFSSVAIASVALLIGTGTVASWIHLPGAGALWTTGYGRLLVLKVALVLTVLGLGTVNWKRLTPVLSTPAGPPAMRRSAAAELTVAMIVLIVTAMLVRTSPLAQ
jgi:putative copper resistance protein D